MPRSPAGSSAPMPRGPAPGTSRSSAPGPGIGWTRSPPRRGWCAGTVPRRRSWLVTAPAPATPAAAAGVTAQELAWGVDVEGAADVDDLLDRRTRLGLVAADREASVAAAEAAPRAGVTAGR